ncbi:MAG TPA: M20 family peptidase, partial [Acidobacteriota bacterium]|nr:M20 family peptidase [Acidobacteriota bacterium]
MQVDELIDRKELTALLADLVSIRSVNTSLDPDGSEKEISEFIQDYLSSYSILFETQEVWPDRPNVIATIPGRTDRNLLFESHMDTVPL